MTGQIRPNRMEVSDRFPMLGFAVRTDEPNVDAEVVLANDTGLFQPQNRPSRTAANFYSSREHGTLSVPRGEGVFVVPPEVLARFIGSEKLFFGLATGKRNNGGLHVDAIPREGSPYVTLRGFTGRTLRRSFAATRPGGPPLLEWTGDAAKPGSEPTNGAARTGNGAAKNGNGHAAAGANGNGSAPSAATYDDGFGPIPAVPAREASHSRAMIISREDVDRARAYAPRWADLFNWTVPPAVASALAARGFSVQRIQDAAGALNLDQYEVECTRLPTGFSAAQVIQRLRMNMNGFLDTDNTEFIPYGPSDVAQLVSASPVGAVWKLDIAGPDNAAVVLSASEPRYFRVTTIETPDTGAHPVSGHREFGYVDTDAGTVFYTRAADRSTHGLLETLIWLGADHLWRSLQERLVNWINANGGAASARTPFSERFHPEVVRILYGSAQAQGLSSSGPAQVMPQMPGDQRDRARRIGGAFSDRIGEAIDLGLQPSSLDPLLDVLGATAAPAPMARARGLSARALADDEILMPAAPGPRARAMDGGVGVAVAIGGFVVETIRDSQGDVTWELDQFRGVKHPNDAAPANPGAFRDGATIRLDDWPVSGNAIDDISAWFKIDWQNNGKSLGNVRITNIGTNDAALWGLHVRAQIMDDNQVYPPSNCAALRLTFHYRFSRSIGSDIIALREVTLYGDGSWRSSGDWVQSTTFAKARSLSGNGDDVLMPASPAPRARALDNPRVEVGTAIGGFVVESIRDSQGDVTWELDQFRGIKHPNDTAPANPGAFRDGATIRLDDWPVSGNVVDDISAWFKIDWQCNGQSLGNVRITNIGTNDAALWGLHVRAQIMDDNQVYPPSNCAALRLTFHYRFSRSIGSDIIALREVTLFGDGSWRSSGDWVQSTTFAKARSLADNGEEVLMPAAPGPRARAMDGGVGVAIAIGGFVVETIRDSQGDVTWELDQFRGVKHPNDTAPANPGPFRDGATIRLDDWPVSGNAIDDISAWFKIDWQHNGRSLGNVRITNIGTNDAALWGLHVRAQIMDDNQVYPPSNCAALRLTFHYRFSRSIGSDIIALREVTLYGDGSWRSSGDWVQSSSFGMAQGKSAGRRRA